MSYSFFNILLEFISASCKHITRNIIYKKSSRILGYADDLDVIGRTTEAVANNFLAIEKEADDVGL